MQNENASARTHEAMEQLTGQIKSWGVGLGFQRVGVADTKLQIAEQQLDDWLGRSLHGEMDYMAKHGRKRSRPELLVPGTLRVISARMDYLPNDDDPLRVLNHSQLGYIARYAVGRDYHKLMRKRLQKLAQQIQQTVGDFGYRVFVDSAPVLEKPLAALAGLGWQGKHSNLLSREAGGWFFLGEIYTNLPLTCDQPETNHCGRCTECIDVCPTQAIIEPYTVDSRRCISYLTIEYHGSIPLELRPMMGNRIYGCDDCLLVCPWNRFAQPTGEQDFAPRNGLEGSTLETLFSWNEDTFLHRMEGSPIRRIGHDIWLRNIAVALGNASTSDSIIDALRTRLDHSSPLVREHCQWALEKHQTVISAG